MQTSGLPVVSPIGPSYIASVSHDCSTLFCSSVVPGLDSLPDSFMYSLFKTVTVDLIFVDLCQAFAIGFVCKL